MTVEKDCLVRELLRNRFSGRRIHFLREKGRILLNGEPVTVLARAKKGDALTLLFKETLSFDYPPQDMGVIPVYSDEDVTVVYKPAGVPSMPAAPHFDGNLFNNLKLLYPDGVFRVVTRLDKDTSGLVLLANNALSHSILHDEMNTIEKTYTALVEGKLTLTGEINAPIAASQTAKREVGEGGKPSLSRIIGVEPLGGATLVTLRPVTGRTHQLRVHLAHVGHPIVGDLLYGGRSAAEILKSFPDLFGQMDEGAQAAPVRLREGQLLCCNGLTFIHPLKRQKMAIFTDGKGEISGQNKIFTINSQKTPV